MLLIASVSHAGVVQMSDGKEQSGNVAIDPSGAIIINDQHVAIDDLVYARLGAAPAMGKGDGKLPAMVGRRYR